MRRPGATGSSLMAGFLFLAGGPAAADGTSWDRDPRLGGERGRSRARIQRHPAEVVEVPDVVVLKDGSSIEAYWLAAYGDRLVFYVKETEHSWLRDERSRSEVAEVRFGEYLDRDPLETRSIERARKQPVPKDDILSGVFAAALGRNGSIAATFSSEIDKVVGYSEDATDYGSFELESRMTQGDFRGAWSHGVRATGKYHLYAPSTIRNRDWVLSLTEVVHSEVEKTWDTSLHTSFVPDEHFILYFSPGKESFRLEWSNAGNWTWASLTQTTFRRIQGGDARSERDRDREWMRHERGAKPRRLEPARTAPTAPVLAARAGAAGSPGPSGQPARASFPEPPRRWGIHGWKRPAYRLEGEK